MKLPRTCPKSSVSRSVSDSAAQLTVMSARTAARAACVNQPRDDFLAGAALAGDQNLGVAPCRVKDLFLKVEDGWTRTNEFRGLHRRTTLSNDGSRFYSALLAKLSRYGVQKCAEVTHIVTASIRYRQGRRVRQNYPDKARLLEVLHGELSVRRVGARNAITQPKAQQFLAGTRLRLRSSMNPVPAFDMPPERRFRLFPATARRAQRRT